MMLPSKKRYIEVPKGGWKERTFYVVVVSVGPANPVWGAILFSGFLNGLDGGPGGYASVWNGGVETVVEFHKLHFLKILREIEDVPTGHINEEDLAAWERRTR